MEIKTKYNIGDVVNYNYGIIKLEQCKCDACEGSGKLELKNGRILRCPKCYGDGVKVVEVSDVDERCGTIKEIRVDVCEETVVMYSIAHDYSKRVLEKDIIGIAEPLSF